MTFDGPLLSRFIVKLIFDILPAALASVIGGILFTHYQSAFIAAPKPAAEQIAPATAEMVKLVREEHAAVVDFLNAQTAAEKSRRAVEDEEWAHSVAEAKTAVAVAAVAGAQPTTNAPPAAAPRRPDAAAAAAKSAAARVKPAANLAKASAPPRAPLMIAQAQPIDSVAPAAPAEVPARDPDSLLAKTLDIKDRVVDATLHVIGTIGSIPSIIGSMADRGGGSNASSQPAGRLVGAPS